ncbi:MAG: hypothetical protein HQ582_17980, partial [Planctomycetes bacterium]|nr:hypothetical protein [Planctomycetota bacterium]
MIPEKVLYSELVPTLGDRAIPALFVRLKEASEKGDLYLTNEIVAAIGRIRSGDAVSRAIVLLDDDCARVQRAGMKVLAENPSGQALDQLWELHCTGQAAPAPFLSERESSFFLYQDSFDALRSCTRLDPSWLERAIVRADPETEPVHDLAYLVASVDDGGALWRRCKPVLREKIPAHKERSLATNIAQYRDKDEVEWLIERVSRADDVIGPSALRALIRIDQRLALEHLDRLPEKELYFTRQWYLPELMMRLPDETRARLLQLLREHPEPWRLAMVFQGQENSVDVPILEFLLDALEPLLDSEIAEGIPEGKASAAWLPFSMLVEITRAGLLECFRRRRKTTVEKRLTDWLLWRGPQRGNWREHDKHDGLAVLARIGGEGLAVVVNDWLRSENRFARLHAIELSSRNPDPETIAMLVERTMSDELWDKFPVEQGYAAASLAASARWQPVIQYLVRWGLRALTRVTDYDSQTGRLDDEAMASALD